MQSKQVCNFDPGEQNRDAGQGYLRSGLLRQQDICRKRKEQGNGNYGRYCFDHKNTLGLTMSA
jgi:hypothetical protein